MISQLHHWLHVRPQEHMELRLQKVHMPQEEVLHGRGKVVFPGRPTRMLAVTNIIMA